MKETNLLEGRDEVIARFKGIPFFASFSESDLRLLIQSSKLCVYQVGERIIQEGNNDQWMYILLSGTVHVTKGSAQIAMISDFGSIFGELTALSHVYRSASVTAIFPTTCIAIELKIFDHQKDPEKSQFYSVIYRLLAINLCERLLFANEEVTQLRLEVNMLKDQLLVYKKES